MLAIADNGWCTRTSRPRMIAVLVVLFSKMTFAASLQQSADRMELDVANGKPLVAHVIVALCDNKYQGIIPVPAAIGDGDNPATNLYWGAAYGVKTFFTNSKIWQVIKLPKSSNPYILDRVLFKRVIQRNGKPVVLYVYAEAWQGRYIAAAIEKFISITNGNVSETVQAGAEELAVGNRAHVVAYVGHNGLMDFRAPAVRQSVDDSNARAAMILACKSDPYFREMLGRASLLLTTRSFMAPEAYSLEASLYRWFSGGNQRESIDAAAGAYAKYQRISMKAAQSVFVYPSASNHE